MCFMEMTGLTVAPSSNYQHLAHKSAFVEMITRLQQNHWADFTELLTESLCVGVWGPSPGAGGAPGADR